MHRWPSRPPITERKIRIALAGCGRIAANHFNAIERHAERCELTDVCDDDPAALAAAVTHTKARGHSRFSEMLDATEADLVVLATPSGLHPAQTIEAARAGFDVMTEKPMATRWSDGLAMVRACDEAGVRLFVVKQNRRNRTLQLLKQAMEADELGKNVGDDLREGKPTLPLLLAMERAAEDDRVLIRRAIEHGENEKLPEILALVRRTGALDATRAAATREADKARALLGALPPSRARDALLELCVRSVHRSS